MEAGPGGVRVAVVEAGAYASAFQSRAVDGLARLADGGQRLFGDLYRVAESALRQSATRLPSAEPVVSAVCRALTDRWPRHPSVSVPPPCGSGHGASQGHVLFGLGDRSPVAHGSLHNVQVT
ncbi:hypothetical protein [Streptomyces beigongshangae]|uniref:hypothetical protein n=1 Tax=Streptomyces beigongshangae TaxID=2841597 RepID=UPI0021A26358|nr:hypothetical protein [Streptomyces sp. REN17]